MTMKVNLKFFITVASLLLTSSVILTGCMFAVGESEITTQAYDMGSQLADVSSGIIDNSPIPQTELDKKFWSMYEIDEANGAITVITKEAHEKYLSSFAGADEYPSLTVEEVLYIVNDSVRIYKEYDTIILTELKIQMALHTCMMELIPGQVITHEGGIEYLSGTDDKKAVYDIIMYRLRALSTPKAFISADYAIRYAGGDPMTYSSMYPQSEFYIPNYSKNTDLHSVLYYFGNHKDAIDKEQMPPYFTVNSFSSDRITLAANGAVSDVYPVNEQKMLVNTSFSASYFYGIPEDPRCGLTQKFELVLDPHSGSFSFTLTEDRDIFAQPSLTQMPGRFKIEGNSIYLYHNGGENADDPFLVFRWMGSETSNACYDLTYIKEESEYRGTLGTQMNDRTVLKALSADASLPVYTSDFLEKDGFSYNFDSFGTNGDRSYHNGACEEFICIEHKNNRYNICSCGIITDILTNNTDCMTDEQLLQLRILLQKYMLS